MKLLQVNLDDDELRVLFKALDKAGTGSITYKQFVTEFPEINVSYMVKKIKNIIIGSKVSIDLIYEKYCTDKKTNKMS
jgi:Ca2+-binding EF-hand superfamily protein